MYSHRMFCYTGKDFRHSHTGLANLIWSYILCMMKIIRKCNGNGIVTMMCWLLSHCCGTPPQLEWQDIQTRLISLAKWINYSEIIKEQSKWNPV